MLAFTALKAGNLGVTGATGRALERALIGLRTLVDRSVADVRVAAGLPARHELISLADFLDQIGISAVLEAHARECKFTVSAVDERLAVDV
jgi:hypothetical protein